MQQSTDPVCRTFNHILIAPLHADSEMCGYTLRSPHFCSYGHRPNLARCYFYSSGVYSIISRNVQFNILQSASTDLKRAQEQNRLERRWRVYLRPDILIIDEVGYLKLDRTEAELLFRLVCQRYEHGSIILTSNKFFSDWGELMSDTVIATAMLDRLLHHAHVVNIRCDTYRLKDRRKSGVTLTPPVHIPAFD